MKLIKPSFKIINQEDNLEGIYEAIENAGRTCYKSIGTRYFKIPLSGSNMPEVWHYVHENIACYTKVEGDGVHSQILNGYASIADKDVKSFEGLDKYECEFNPKYHKNITAKDFTERMIKSGHLAMLEFGTVYLKFYSPDLYGSDYYIYHKYESNPYSKVTIKSNDIIGGNIFITTNYRVLIENNWLDDLCYLCSPTEFHEERVCVRFTTSIAISRALNRHRVDSISEQSTRYCNYSNDKFGNELTFIIPSSLNEEELKKYGPYQTVVRDKKSPESIFITNLNNAERDYLELIKLGWKPQQARDILPLDLATEVNHCAFVSDWKHFFSLRSSHAGATGMHPDMDYIANKIYDEFLKRKYIN